MYHRQCHQRQHHHLNHSLKLWNINTGKLINTLAGHRSHVCAIAFSPDGQHLASGSADGTVKLWDLNTRQELYIFG
ncbi:MAG: WD40 repeat domain-containing protein [Nostoc sp.]